MPANSKNIYNIDLHIHSPYSAAVSKNMSIPLLATEAKKKGLDIIVTADILHPKWLTHVKDNLILDSSNCFVYKDDLNSKLKTYFILGVEVEVKFRVHHLLYFRDFEQVESFRKKIEKYSSDINKYGGGRPRLSIDSKELLDLAIEENIIIGPAHAFTPYFGIYAHYNSLRQAYGENYKYVKFIELGLSADSALANKIPDLSEIKFFCFSDSHSAASYRIGREYIKAKLEKPNFDSLKNLLEASNSKENYIIENIGYNPLEGKYNQSACSSCHQLYTLDQANNFNWKCALCKKSIKKGVSDRIKEVAIFQGNCENIDINKNRPPYIYLMPLLQVIQLALKQKNALHKSVLEKYELFIKNYSEIEIMQRLDKQTLD
ncbi:MAG: endonuclease Q family protein, partial [archaeon]